MKKIIILFISVILLTGCSANSTVTIGNDNSVKEKVVITEKLVNIPERNINVYVKKLLDAYGLKNYKYSIKKQGPNVLVTFKSEYKNVCEYLDSSYFVNSISANSKCDKGLKNFNIKYHIKNKSCPECLEKEEPVFVTYSLSKDNIVSVNADNQNGRYYKWKFSSDDNKDINLKVKRHITIPDILSGSKILLIIIPVLLIGIIAYVLKKKYENNKISY